MGKPLVCGLFGPHPHAHRTKIVMCGARTRRTFFAPARAPETAHFFLLIKLSFSGIFLQKHECADVPRTSTPKRGARTRTYIFENFSAPIRTKFAAPARTLKVWNLHILFEFCISGNHIFLCPSASHFCTNPESELFEIKINEKMPII